MLCALCGGRVMVRRCAGGKGSRRREDLPRAIIADKLRLRYGCLGCWKKNLWEGCRVGNSCAFFIGILRFWNAERPKWRSALKIQEKPAISMDCRFLCFHYTMNEIQMVRSRTVTCVITSRRRSSPTIYSNASSASLQTISVSGYPIL